MARHVDSGRSNIACLLTILMLAVSATASANPPAAPVSREAIDAAVGDLVTLAGQGRIDQMLERIGPIPDSEREESEKTRQRVIHLYATSGKYSGFDVAGVKVLTPRYQVAYVMAYFEKRPAMFEFGLYQVDGKWRAQSVRVETDFRAILDTMPLQR